MWYDYNEIIIKLMGIRWQVPISDICNLSFSFNCPPPTSCFNVADSVFKFSGSPYQKNGNTFWKSIKFGYNLFKYLLSFL